MAFLCRALPGPQVDQDVDEGVLVGDGLAVAQPGTLDAQFLGLAVDALGGGPLLVDCLVYGAVAVELIANAGADAGGQCGHAATFGPVLVANGTDASRDYRERQGADVTATLVLEAGGTTSVSMPEGYGQSCLTQGQALGIE